ncbi:MAG: acyltransferase [Terracidiphilus sp.]|jgi:peptidoglycan/LPS O-acetylase OafA/YrhL
MKSKYTNLDLLRSIAVFSVVSSHMWYTCVEYHVYAANPLLSQFLHSFSIVGVTFFFVHTCLVLMLSMHRAPDAHRARSFLIRRAFRIYPLCWAAILLALATGLTDLPESNLHALEWRGILANLLLIQNLLRGRGVPSVIGPLWSLPWEVQMYLVLPIFFIVLRRFERVGTVFAIWFGSALLAVVGSQPWAHHLEWTTFPPLFIAGMVAYRLLIWQSKLGQRFALPAWLWPGFVLSLFVVAPLLIGGSEMDTPAAAIIKSCNCFLLGIAIPFFRELTAGWIVGAAQQIAKYSYGIYLLHVPAILFCFRFFPGLPPIPKIVLSLAATALVSFLSFHIIEDPLIRVGKRITRPVDPDRTNAGVTPPDQRARVATGVLVRDLNEAEVPNIEA